MELWSQYILPCLCAFAGCIGFTLVFNIHGPGKLIAGCGGALGWLVYLLGGKTILAGFFAAMAISLFSEVMARIRRCPVTGYQLVALLPLVPGGGIYYAMGYCLEGDTESIPERPAGHPGHGGSPGGWASSWPPPCSGRCFRDWCAPRGLRPPAVQTHNVSAVRRSSAGPLFPPPCAAGAEGV